MLLGLGETLSCCPAVECCSTSHKPSRPQVENPHLGPSDGWMDACTCTYSMYVPVLVCIRLCLYLLLRLCMYVCMYVCMQTCMHAYVYVEVSTPCICIYVCDTCMCRFLYVCVYMHACMHACAYVSLRCLSRYGCFSSLVSLFSAVIHSFVISFVHSSIHSFLHMYANVHTYLCMCRGIYIYTHVCVYI